MTKIVWRVVFLGGGVFAAADHGQHPELEEQRWDSEMQAIWTVARYWEERL